MFIKDHLAAVKELRVGIEAARKALAAVRSAKRTLARGGDGGEETVAMAQAKADKALGDLREVTEGLVPRVEELKRQGGNKPHLVALTAEIEKEVSWSSWLVELEKDQKALDVVTGAVEVFAAQLECGDTVDDVSEHVIGAIGEERVREGVVFVEWFEEHVGGFLLESGHLVLGKGLGRKCVYHAGKSGSSGLCDMVWEKVARRWEWMAGHPGGFVVAGRELVALGRERVGLVLMQNGHLGEKAVAMRLAAIGGPEMEGEVRDVIGIEPYGGGRLDEAFEFQLVGRGEEIWCVTGDGAGRIVTGGAYGTMDVWDASSGKRLTSQSGSGGRVNAAVVVSGKVISGSNKGATLRVWDVTTGRYKQLIDHGVICSGLCVLDETTVVSCGMRGVVSVWKMDAKGKWREDKQLPGQASQVNCVVALEGGRVASGGIDKIILVHDVGSGDVVGKLEGHTHGVNDLAVLADGRLVSASSDSTVRVWPSGHTPGTELILKWNGAPVKAVCALENGRLVSGDYAGMILLWVVEESSWKMLGQIRASLFHVLGLHSLGGGRFVSVAHNGYHSGQRDPHVKVWDASRFRGGNPFDHLSLACGTVLRDGRIVSGGKYGEVVIWKKAERGKEAVVEHVIQGNGGPVTDLAATTKGFAWRRNQSIFLYESGSEAVKLDVAGNILCVAGGGSTLVVDTREGTHVYDAEEKKLLKILKASRDWEVRWAQAYVWGPQQIVVVGQSGRVTLVNLESGSVEKHFLYLSRGVFRHQDSIACLGEGKLGVVLWSGLRIWDKNVEGEPTMGYRDASVIYESVGDGRVVLKTRDNAVIVWNWKTAEKEAEFGGLDGRDVVDVAWDASRRLAVFFMEKERCWYAYEL